MRMTALALIISLFPVTASTAFAQCHALCDAAEGSVSALIAKLEQATVVVVEAALIALCQLKPVESTLLLEFCT